MNNVIDILLIEDNPDDHAIIRNYLRKGFAEGHRLVWKQRMEEAMEHLAYHHVDIVLLDLGLPDSSGLESLARVHSAAGNVPVVVLSGNGEQETALQAVREGAQDYFPKQRLNPDALARVVRFGIERQKLTIAERELQAADRLQARLFPTDPPDTAALNIAGISCSAGKGCGDYYDFFQLPSGEIGLAVGDVSGHGMAAALRMVETRAYLRSLTRRHSDPGTILTELNRFMIEESAYVDDDAEQFVTLFFAAVDPESLTLRHAGAGHVAFLLGDDGCMARLESTGLPLGVADLSIETGEPIQLTDGDMLMIATDGFEEAMSPSGEQFGVTRLLSRVVASRHQPSADILAGLHADVREFTRRDVQRDDVTAILMNVGQTLVRPERIRRHDPAAVERRLLHSAGQQTVLA